MLRAVVSCLLSVSKSVTTFKKFGVNEFAGGLLLSRRPCVVRASTTRHEWPTTAGPTAATLGSIQTASRHPGPWDTLGLVGARAGLNRARPHAHTPAGMHRARAVLRRLDSVS